MTAVIVIVTAVVGDFFARGLVGILFFFAAGHSRCSGTAAWPGLLNVKFSDDVPTVAPQRLTGVGHGPDNDRPSDLTGTKRVRGGPTNPTLLLVHH